MRARLVFTAMLAVLALLTVGGGAALAQGGLDDSTSAATQQYGEDLGVIGEVETVEPTPAATTPAPPSAPPPAAPVQQQEGNLPFTGFAGLTVVLLGAALLGAGLVLRRTTRRRDDISG